VGNPDTCLYQIHFEKDARLGDNYEKYGSAREAVDYRKQYGGKQIPLACWVIKR
jgi:hypothetical protein